MWNQVSVSGVLHIHPRSAYQAYCTHTQSYTDLHSFRARMPRSQQPDLPACPPPKDKELEPALWSCPSPPTPSSSRVQDRSTWQTPAATITSLCWVQNKPETCPSCWQSQTDSYLLAMSGKLQTPTKSHQKKSFFLCMYIQSNPLLYPININGKSCTNLWESISRVLGGEFTRTTLQTGHQTARIKQRSLKLWGVTVKCIGSSWREGIFFSPEWTRKILIPKTKANSTCHAAVSVEFYCWPENSDFIGNADTNMTIAADDTHLAYSESKGCGRIF